MNIFVHGNEMCWNFCGYNKFIVIFQYIMILVVSLIPSI